MAESRTGWDRVSDFLQARELWALFWTVGGGSYIASRVGRMLPMTLDPQDKLWLGLSAFCFGSVGFLLVWQSAAVLWPKISRWSRVKLNPPALLMTVNTGRKASITLKHKGEPAHYVADGKIVRTLDGSPNPMSAPYECQLQYKGIASAARVLLAHDDWANIIIASIEEDRQEGGESLMVRRGGQGNNETVRDSGVLIEIAVRADPPLYNGARMARYRVVRDNYNIIVTEEIIGP